MVVKRKKEKKDNFKQYSFLKKNTELQITIE